MKFKEVKTDIVEEHCRECGSGLLVSSTLMPVIESMYRNYSCLHCNHIGKFWYKIKYKGAT